MVNRHGLSESHLRAEIAGPLNKQNILSSVCVEFTVSMFQVRSIVMLRYRVHFR